MASQQHLKKIFLSASIPFKDRHPSFFETADVVAIRDSIVALATVVIPHAQLVWGGHPSITPLIRYVMARMNLSYQDHVLLYQSEFFRDQFPDDNDWFRNVVITAKKEDLSRSIAELRNRMFSEHSFDYGIFIGGMEGVLDEFQMLNERHPNVVSFPVGSTGAAARILYYSMSPTVDERLLTEYAYMSLFQDLFDTK